MRQAFTLALLASITLAAPANLRSNGKGDRKDKKKNDPAFLQFAAEYNKDIRAEETFDKKQKKFHENVNIINEVNEKADRSGKKDALRLKANWTIDLETEEYL